MGIRIFLGLSALVWLAYGLQCFLQPSHLEATAGVAFRSPTGSSELRAMYGGLQLAIGGLALSGALRASMAPSALIALLALCAGLGGARLLGALLDDAFSSYTIVALAFEGATVALAAWMLRTASV